MALDRDTILKTLQNLELSGWSPQLISDLKIDGETVILILEVDPALARGLEPLCRKLEDYLGTLDGVGRAQVVMTAEAKADSAKPAPAAQPSKTQAPKRGGPIPGVDKIIAVASGKGGVGKSTTALNLALALQEQGLVVGLLDADIYGPSVPKLTGTEGIKPQSPDNHNLAPIERFGLKLMSMGYLVGKDTAMIWRGPMVQSALSQMLYQVLWGPLDVLVVDMPPGTGDAQLTLAQQVPVAGAVIVSTPQDLALIDAKKGISMFNKVNIPILGLVENMSHFICPNCQHESHIFGHGGAQREAEASKQRFLGGIPLEMAIREGSDLGQPVFATDPQGPHAAAYRGIATQVLTALRPEKKGLWSRLTGRG